MPHLVEGGQAEVIQDLEIQRIGLGGFRGFLFEFPDNVRPELFAAAADFCQCLDAVPQRCAAIGRYRMADDPFVVIDEQPRRHEVGKALLDAIELDRTCVLAGQAN